MRVLFRSPRLTPFEAAGSRSFARLNLVSRSRESARQPVVRSIRTDGSHPSGSHLLGTRIAGHKLAEMRRDDVGDLQRRDVPRLLDDTQLRAGNPRSEARRVGTEGVS